MATPKSKPAAKNTTTVPDEVALAYAARGELSSTCHWIFEVDYSINSRKPRFFIYNVTTGAFYMYKCAHGSGGKNGSPHDGKCREVSNKDGSHCTALGRIKTGEHYNSDNVGQAVKLGGLSSTNSNNNARGIVLHGGNYVTDNATNTDTEICGRSWGCIVVDDQYINKEDGGELIEWLKDGSIGVAHYAGKFTI
jgi:hypothetical protein